MSVHKRFYQTFIHLYDRFFPVSPSLVDSLERQVGDLPLRRVLDVGCGTGGAAFSLRQRGWTVDGFDPSAEMIDIARRKEAAMSGAFAGGRFWVGRMEHIGRMEELGVLRSAAATDESSVLPGDRGYGAVLCLGNTLAHAASRAEVERICAAMRTVLRPPAVCIVQGIDFEHVVRHSISELAPIEAAGYRFRRRYGAVDQDGHIPFSITIESVAAQSARRKEGTVGPSQAETPASETLESETRLLALGERDVIAALVAAGFDSVQRVESLSGSGETGGLELVVVARLFDRSAAAGAVR